MFGFLHYLSEQRTLLRTNMRKSVHRVVVALLPLSVLMLAPDPVTANSVAEVSSQLPVIEQQKASAFPMSAELSPRVDFWRHVYSTWALNQTAIHDYEYLGLIYDVVKVPGTVSDSYTAQQREWVEDKRSAVAQRLRYIELNADSPENLRGENRELYDMIVRIAGKEAIYGAHKRVRSQRGLRERFHRGVEISGRYDAVFRAIFKEHKLPEDLAYLPHVESSFQSTARSSAGAVGLWQFTRPTGLMFMKINHAIDERLDPIASARASARYLSKAYNLLGSWPLAVTSYNHGMSGMLRAQKIFGNNFDSIVRHYDSPYFGFASKNFYAEFLAARDIARNPEQYFPEGIDYLPLHSLESIVLDQSIKAPVIAKMYNLSIADIAKVNPAWSQRAIKGSVALPAGVEVWLPSGTAVASNSKRSTSVRLAMAAKSYQDNQPKPPSIIKTKQITAAKEFHVVRRKETLFAIAKKYGISLATLRELNKLSAKQSTVKVGQKLRIRAASQKPTSIIAKRDPSSHTIHVVRKGDNAFVIAANYGISVAELMSANKLTPNSVIYPGQKFQIPRAR